MKLPEKIEEFNLKYTDFIETIKIAIESNTDEVLDEAELQNNVVIQNAAEGNFEQEKNIMQQLDEIGKQHVAEQEAKRKEFEAK